MMRKLINERNWWMKSWWMKKVDGKVEYKNWNAKKKLKIEIQKLKCKNWNAKIKTRKPNQKITNSTKRCKKRCRSGNLQFANRLASAVYKFSTVHNC